MNMKLQAGMGKPVRDKIPQIIVSDGKSPIVRTFERFSKEVVEVVLAGKDNIEEESDEQSDDAE